MDADSGSFVDALGMSPDEVVKAEEAAEAVTESLESHDTAAPTPETDAAPAASKPQAKQAPKPKRAASKAKPKATATRKRTTSKAEAPAKPAPTRKKATAQSQASASEVAEAPKPQRKPRQPKAASSSPAVASTGSSNTKPGGGGAGSGDGGSKGAGSSGGSGSGGSGGGDDLRNRWNDSATEYPRNMCMHDLFERQAKVTPDAIAAICDGSSLTYAELDERANYLALYLREQGVAHGELVGLLLERSLDMLVGLLGIFKAGAAYLPLDPNYPGERLAYMFEDAEIQTLLTEKALMDNLPEGAPRAIQIDEDWPEIKAAAEAAIHQRVPLKHVDAEGLAYVIYTSGSTGKPKGVMIQHRALTNFLVTMAEKPGCHSNDHVIALTTICFDIAALELYLPLIVGAKVDILPSRITRDGLALKEYLDNTQPTLVQATPATWTMLLAAEWRGQTNRQRPLRILTGGEPMTEKLAEQLLERASEVWNMYGPTETTIWSSVWQAQLGEKISIGWPIANTQFYVLNENKELMDVDQEGELWIGGDGVAKGYLNREQYNRERFIQNPFNDNPNDRIYKTGDLVRLCSDGRVECLGRVDQQIKLRGHRIELGEIESQLAKIPAVREAVVTAREDIPGNRDLVGFLLVQDDEAQPKNSDIAETIAQWLPRYMVPTRYFWLHSYPETLNRKVDRKTLTEKPLDELLEAHGSSQPSETEEQQIEAQDSSGAKVSSAEVSQGLKQLLEERLVRELKSMASEILGIPEGDFDSETPIGNYGFNSVNHTTLSIRLNKGLGIKTNPTLFFQHPTFKAVSEHLSATFGDALRKHFGLKESDVRGRLAQTNKRVKRSKTKPKSKPVAKIQPGEHEPIAIVGIAARLPGAQDTDQFWQNISGGQDLIREIPEDRWDMSMYFGDQAEDHLKITSKWGGYIEGAFQFDAPFFNISPREAELMDPEQRLFMQAVWHAIENSGHATNDFQGTRTGVFLGVTGFDYMERQWEYRQRIDGYTYQGLAQSIKSNRISYLLDLHGPSSSIDTACSSSLIAVTRAVESIRAGQCEMAIAGGVSLLFSPYLYIAFSRADMLSPDGRCKTFDKDANGYVRGEGVGTVVLKPLSVAEAEGDHIYAVIRGVSENHGGRTNTLSAPNPNAQAELLSRAYEDGKIDPATVGFIETHGTGTPLGDPIEVNGIKKAFEQLYAKWGHDPASEKHIGLGSVKTQIGHLEGAAGIAGLMKVLLAMKHKVLPGNLHFRKLNPYISLDDTPFYVHSKTQPWQPILDKKGKPLPRRAGVSSFGYGGSNAHLVVEEYIPREVALPPEEAQLFVLSAKNDERLDAYTARMLSWLKASRESDTAPHPAHLAYTLQMGRDPMPERLAIVFNDIDDLCDKLSTVADGGKLPDGVFRGHVRDHRSLSELIGEGEEGEAFVQSVLDARRMSTLARFWIAGVALDFEQLHEHYETRRVPLPGYPFAPTRFRFQESMRRPEEDGVARLHPLINTNESTLYEQCFKKVFSGREFVLADNVVGGNEMLMSTCYLEMARAAGNLANKPHQVTVLKDVVFVRRYAYAKKNASLYVRLFPRGNEVRFEISSEDEEKRNVDSQGKIVYGDPQHDIGASEIVDIAAVQARCWNPIGGEECYGIWEQAGIDYGKTLQALQSLRHNDEESIAELALPEQLSDDFSEWVLHPSLLAGGLQSIVGLAGNMMTQNIAPLIAFSVGEVRLIRPLTPRCFVYVRRLSKSDAVSSFQKFNITLMDEEGRVQVVMKDFAMRPMASQQRKLHLPDEKDDFVSVYLQGVWEQSQPLVERIGDNPFEREVWGHVLLFDYDGAVREELIAHLHEIALEYDKVVLVKPGIVFAEDPEEEGVFEINPSDYADYQLLIETLKERDWMPSHIVHLWSREPFRMDTSVLTYQMDLTLYSSFYLVKSLMAAKPREDMSFIHVHISKDGDPQPQYTAIAGLLRTLRKENHKFQTRSIEYCMHIEDHPEDVNHDLANLLIYEGQWQSKNETEVLYKEGHRWIKCMQEFDPESEADPSKEIKFQDEDVYLITGGAGGLGLLFAKYLAEQARVRLVLVGRSKASDRVDQKLDEVRALGAEVTYISADIALREDTEQLADFVRQEYGRLDGVIHAAGVVRDAFVLKKTREEMEDVIAPKVFGTLNLDDATKDFNLRFFVVFSSLSGVIGNLGQADYAYANYFMDAYMALREEYRIWGDRRGKSLALDWPLWRYGGMQVDEEAEKLITATMGMRALSNEVGLGALSLGLRMRGSSLLVVEGEREKLRQSLGMRFVGSRLHNLLEGHRGYPMIFPDVYSSWVRMPSMLEMGATMAEHAKGPTPTDLPQVSDEFLAMHTEMYLKEAFSKETKLPVHKISVDEPLEEYGIDSVMILRMNAELESFFGELPKTLLFEYQTIEELRDYFVENYRIVLIEKLMSVAELGLEQQNADAEDSGTQMLDLQELAEDRFMHSFGAAVEEVEVAIVGMGGRFPGADDLQKFWEQLKQGYDAVGEVPEDRWDWRRFFAEGKDSKVGSYSKWGGFLSDVDQFDPLFFNISPREAEMMDPQERLFLETAYATLGNAGYSRKDVEGSNMGVFVGVTWGEYTFYGMENALRGETFATDSVYASVANRVSYWLNVHGPSLALDTMCSSSFTALHYAVEGIRRGEMQMAIAGGVNLSLHPSKHILLCKDKFAATDGRCRAFGEGGDGYVPGEGVCAVLLKPLTQAVADGDHIYAVIKGTALNHGGKTNGYSVPNPVAQGDLIRKTLERAKVDPRTLSYIEAHGTGTSLGDPIEISGLNRAFNDWKVPRQFCPIGSVKSNIGHLEAAAGIAGLVKVLLQMEHRTLVPSIHSEHLNPNINFKDTPFYVQRNLSPWPKPQREIEGQPGVFPRMAGISSFGAGGANAHVIVSEFEDTSVAPRTPLAGPKIVVLSAETEARLREYAGQLVAYLDESFGDKAKKVDRLEYLTDLVRTRIVEGAAGLLEVETDQISLDAVPMDMGIDTVMMSDLHAHLCGGLGCELPEQLFKQGYSINRIAREIVLQEEDSLMDAFGDQLPQVSSAVDDEAADEAVTLEAIAYTLQVGRDSLQERLGFMVNSLDELRNVLDGFARGVGDKAMISRGSVKISKNKSSMVLEGEEGRAYLRGLIEKNKLGKLLQIWINGEDVEWRILYGDQAPRRMPLPTVPLDRKKHWKAVPDLYQRPLLPKLLGGDQALRAFSFSAMLPRNTWFLEQSPLARDGMLAGAVWLEVALSAASQQMQSGLQISEAVWVNAPVLRHADQGVELLVSSDAGSFEIGAVDSDGQDQLLAQGKVVALAEGAWQSVDLDALRERMTIKMAAHEVYSSLTGSGLAYGVNFRSVAHVALSGQEALARIEVTPAEMFSDAVCHPALWEGAIQAVAVLLKRERGGTWLNDGVANFALAGRLPLAAWAHVILQAGEVSRTAQAQVVFLDGQGKVLGVAQGVSFEQVEVRTPERKAPVARPARPEYRLLQHGWRKDGEEPEVPASMEGTVVVLANDQTLELARQLLGNLKSVQTHVIAPEGTAGADRTFDFASDEAGKAVAKTVLEALTPIVGVIDISDVYAEVSQARIENMGKVVFLQEMLRANSSDAFPMHHYTRGLVAFENDAPTLAGGDIAGLYRMLGAEYKKVQAKTIDVDLDLSDGDAFRALVFRELCIRDRVGEVCYRKGTRYLPQLQEVHREHARTQRRRFPLEAEKVYVVTGGTRGIGAQIGERLAAQGARKLVLMGFTPLPPQSEWQAFVNDRSAKPGDVAKVERFLKLKDQGVALEIYAGSLTDEAKLKSFFADVRKRLGSIGGVVHCAGSDLNNNPAFINKSAKDMAWVAEAKLPGLEALRTVFADDKLDFFVMFSSVAAVLPRLGSGIADYAYANAYLDYVAHFERAQGRPWFRAFQWPSWRDVGMGEVKSLAYRQSGLSAMPTEDGMRLLELALSHDAPVLLPCLTELNDFEPNELLLLRPKRKPQAAKPATPKPAKPVAQSLQRQTPISAPVASTPVSTVQKSTGQGDISVWLRELFAKELKMQPSEMDGETDFGDYGLESILLAELVSTISAHLKVELDPSVILEFPTLNGLSDFLRRTYPDKCGAATPTPAPVATAPIASMPLQAAPRAAQADLGSQMRAWLQQLVGGELKIAPADLDVQAAFEDLGVESIMLAELTQKIGDGLKVDLDPSLILEYGTIESLAEHLVTAYADAVRAKFPGSGAAPSAPVAAASSQAPSTTTAATPGPRVSASAGCGLHSRFKTRAVHTGLSEQGSARQPIAIIGMGCHFPKANSAGAYWQNLNRGIDCISEIPPLRWNIDDFYVQQYRKGKSISKWGGFIDQVEYFDPKYFGISEEEAIHMDPLVRQFLEVSAETMAHAGYGRKDLWNRKVGVYVGSRMANYAERIVDRMKTSVVGVAQNFIAAHVSHFFNFKGPNMVVDTACSSSLVSLHLACRAILSGECEMAMAGGVDILLDEIPYVELSEGKALSPTGKCYTFDKRANGFVPGEGAGAVLLKPLDKAIADGDRVYAVFEGSAVNNDGHTMGITTPNLDAQVEVIREALADARLSARDISLIESHGTATMIGDPIELKGLTRAFGVDTQDRGFCALSSVKTNMGHLLSAAGIASVIKVALAIHNRRIPASLHCETPNPRFDFSNSPFFVQTQSVDWQPGRLLHAGMSGFGFGGTNAHVILGEPDPALMANYQPQRTPLGAPDFQRKAFWLEKPDVIKRERAPEASASRSMQEWDTTPAYDRLLDFDKIL